MTTDKPKLILVIDQELLDKVDDFRFENRISTRAEAVRQLLRDGLKYNSEKTPDKPQK